MLANSKNEYNEYFPCFEAPQIGWTPDGGWYMLLLPITYSAGKFNSFQMQMIVSNVFVCILGLQKMYWSIRQKNKKMFLPIVDHRLIHRFHLLTQITITTAIAR